MGVGTSPNHLLATLEDMDRQAKTKNHKAIFDHVMRENRCVH